FDELRTQAEFGVTGHVYFGCIGMPFTPKPGVSGTQFMVHAFMPTSIGSPNLAHACANAPGDQLGKEAAEGYSPSNVLLISGNDLDILRQWNERAKQAGRTNESAAEEWH